MQKTFRFLIVALMLCLSTRAFAADPVQLSSTTCPGTGCAQFSTKDRGSVGIQITGTFTATIQFEQTIDGLTWTTLSMIPNGSTTPATSATAAGYWTASLTAIAARARISAYTSGTASVSQTVTTARASSGSSSAATGASSTASPADPTGTISNAGVMMGLAVAITPVTTGRIAATMTCDIGSTISGDVGGVVLVSGTGTAPTNGVAQPGGSTQFSGTPRFTSPAINARLPVSITGRYTGTLNVATWIDPLVFLASGTGTISIKRCFFFAYEY